MSTFIIYDDAKKRRSGPDLSDMNPVVFFAKHAANWFQLKAIKKETPDFQIQQQAQKEMEIANRKMDYWRRHAEFKIEDETRIISELKRKWNK